MSSRAINIILVSLLVLEQFCQGSAAQPAGDANEDCALQIYLPREVTIKEDCLWLGQVSLVRGSDFFVAKASQIPLGRISVPGQEIVIDRPMVLSRLACNGIPSSKVTLLGAEKVKVKKQQKTIKGGDFVKRASSFLKDNPLTACQLEPLSIPQDFVVPGDSNNMELRPRLAGTCPSDWAKVQIVVLKEGKQIGSREVTFRLKYNCRTAVTLADIPAGSLINSENVRIENTISSQPEPTDWKPPYGLIAKRHLPANTVLGANMVAPAGRPVVVGRNQSVIIRLEKPGLLVTAVGKTLENGRAGEHIKVRNVDSQRIILARVNEDGTVEPVL
ncbi:MAG: flagellar basal body P-ring formation chaperone FlgA [Planctomycetota bacterium]|nr:flagellar basal body P-ring formation chaperone FlgA [Planctomycetota bacterium]